MIQESQRKTVRLEARTTPALYALVQRAAQLQGRSVSEFVLTAAQNAASELIEKSELLELSLADQQRFANALLRPGRVAPALRKAANAHKKKIH